MPSFQPWSIARAALCAAALLLSAPLSAALHTEVVEYQDGDVKLKGYLAYDDSIEGPRPAVLVAPEWWGLNDYTRGRAEMLAELGYVAFAVDMYGDGKTTDDPKQAEAWMKAITADAGAWQNRAKAGFAALKKQQDVDPEQLAAIGYCFGGSTVMQLAYAGADLAGVASFHGSLPPAPAGVKLKPSVLIAHGDADPMVPPERVKAFTDALNAAGADWQLLSYSGAQHAFTNPAADDYKIPGVKYDEKADARSWDALQLFLGEVFGEGLQ